MVHIIWFKANADLNKEPYHMAGSTKVRTVGVRTVRPVRDFRTLRHIFTEKPVTRACDVLTQLYLTVVCIGKCNLYFLQFYSAGSDRLNLVVKDHPR